MRLGSRKIALRARATALAGALLLTGIGLAVGSPAANAAEQAPGVGPGASSAQITAAAAGNFFQVVDRQAGRCVDVKSYSVEPGVQLQRFTCNTGTNQLWAPVLVSGNSYYLLNNHSGLCIDVRGGSTQAGAEVQQFTCNGTVAQIWVRTPVFIGGALWETLRNQGSGLCLDSTTDTNLIVQRACGAGDSQLWRLR